MQIYIGDTEYIPQSISQSLSKEQQYTLQKEIAESRYSLWKDYWSKVIQINKSISNITNSVIPFPPSSEGASSPTGDPPPGGGNMLSMDGDSGALVAKSGMEAFKKQQVTITKFFKSINK